MSKESLFNILNNHFNFSDLTVLDLFAGTGNISYEFASRGSNNITCVDEDFGCIKFIKQTAAEYDFNIAAVKSNVFSFLEKATAVYDFIFADPPYNLEQAKLEKMVQAVFDRKLLAAGGMMVIEHSKHSKLSHLPNYTFGKNYGGSVFSFFEIAEEAPI